MTRSATIIPYTKEETIPHITPPSMNGFNASNPVARSSFTISREADTKRSDVRRLAEVYGSISSIDDHIWNRGFTFVTYFDIRAAENARNHLTALEINGRTINVRYAIPKSNRIGGASYENERKTSQMSQDTLWVTLTKVPHDRIVNDTEVFRKFGQFGDIKSVQPISDRTDARYVEFYDTRACAEAFKLLRHQGLQDGVMDIAMASDPGRCAYPQQRRGRNPAGDDMDSTADGSKGARPDPRGDERSRSEDWRGGDEHIGDYSHTNSGGANTVPAIPRLGHEYEFPTPSSPPRPRLERVREIQLLLARIQNPSYDAPPPTDRGFASNITSPSLQPQSHLDHVWDQSSTSPPEASVNHSSICSSAPPRFATTHQQRPSHAPPAHTLSLMYSPMQPQMSAQPPEAQLNASNVVTASDIINLLRSVAQGQENWAGRLPQSDENGCFL